MARILVADDEITIRQVVALSCQRLGHDVFEAADADSAIATYAHIEPDLLILDIGMPGGGGPFVLESLRSSRSTALCPVLVISGAIDEAPSQIRRRLSVDRVLPKPFRLSELTASIGELLPQSPGAPLAVVSPGA